MLRYNSAIGAIGTAFQKIVSFSCFSYNYTDKMVDRFVILE